MRTSFLHICYAVQGAAMAEKQRAADDERWHEVSFSTEYE